MIFGMFGERILILIPHPDDEVVGATAALSQAKIQGKKIFGIYLTAGVRSEEKIARRFNEAKTAANLFHIEPVSFINILSRQIKENFSQAREKIIATIKEKRIDCIWAPAYEGGHQDHDVTNFLASALRTFAPVWEFSEYHFFNNQSHRNSFFMRNGTEVVFHLKPEEKAAKKRALACYRSEWFNLKLIRPSLTQEMFRPLVDYDYTNPPYAGKMYYQRFQKFRFHPKIDPITPQQLCTFFAGVI